MCHVFFVVFKVAYNFENLKIDEAKVSVCVGVCLSMCLSLASDSSETINVIIIKFGTVTTSDMRMLGVLIILTSTFLQGHTDLLYIKREAKLLSFRASKLCCVGSKLKLHCVFHERCHHPAGGPSPASVGQRPWQCRDGQR